MTVRQDLPLIVHPEGLERNREPWKLLKWDIKEGRLIVVNDSAYVVRMAQQLELRPSGRMAYLPRTYVLPGEAFSIAIHPQATESVSVKISPATVYGHSVDYFSAPIGSAVAR